MAMIGFGFWSFLVATIYFVAQTHIGIYNIFLDQTPSYYNICFLVSLPVVTIQRQWLFPGPYSIALTLLEHALTSMHDKLLCH